jgi:tetratricopeptide (TPR) repeat protein
MVVPDAVQDLDQLVKLAEIEFSSRPSVFSTLTFGAALYRAGRFAESIEQFNKANADWAPGANLYSPSAAWFFLAMAHQRLDHGEEARKWLDEAIKREEQEKQNPKYKDLWLSRLAAPLLHRECEALVKGSGAGPDKFNQQERTYSKMPKG